MVWKGCRLAVCFGRVCSVFNGILDTVERIGVTYIALSAKRTEVSQHLCKTEELSLAIWDIKSHSPPSAVVYYLGNQDLTR